VASDWELSSSTRSIFVTFATWWCWEVTSTSESPNAVGIEGRVCFATGLPDGSMPLLKPEIPKCSVPKCSVRKGGIADDDDDDDDDDDIVGGCEMYRVAVIGVDVGTVVGVISGAFM